MREYGISHVFQFSPTIVPIFVISCMNHKMITKNDDCFICDPFLVSVVDSTNKASDHVIKN